MNRPSRGETLGWQYPTTIFLDELSYPFSILPKFDHPKRVPHIGWLGYLVAGIVWVLASLPTFISLIPASVEDRFGATVKITGYDDSGEKLNGSGVAISPTLVITAAHVLEGMNTPMVVTRAGNLHVPHEQYFTAKDKDHALLVLQRPITGHGMYFPKVNCAPLKPGDKLWSSGHHYFETWGYYDLAVSGYNIPDDSEVPIKGLIPAQGIFIFGISGGPVWNYRGELVGTVISMLAAPTPFPISAPSGVGGILPASEFCGELRGLDSGPQNRVQPRGKFGGHRTW